MNNNIIEFLNHLKLSRKRITNILLKYESYETVEDEIFRSEDALENIHREGDFLDKKNIKTMCTFFPLNLPLYSLILFAVIPGLMIDKVFIRPPILMKPILEELLECLNLKRFFPHIIFVSLQRHLFLQGFASNADVVLFTGKYTNALKIQRRCKTDCIFIYNGAGVNPIVVGRNANLDLAAEKVINARTFNSGQDCAGPDCILVHKQQSLDFKKTLISKLKQLKVSSVYDHETVIGKIFDTDQLKHIHNYLHKNKDKIIFGGDVDFETSIISPTILHSRLELCQNYHEFFSPIFFVSEYSKDDDLDLYFGNSKFTDFSMYVSVFGDCSYVPKIKNSVILSEEIILDVERAYLPYGGYGPKANFVSFKGKTYVRPILISKEIHQLLKTPKSLEKVAVN